MLFCCHVLRLSSNIKEMLREWRDDSPLRVCIAGNEMDTI